jgi:hypothetical protein
VVFTAGSLIEAHGDWQLQTSMSLLNSAIPFTSLHLAKQHQLFEERVKACLTLGALLFSNQLQLSR